jgi:hypothetical protein
MDITIQSSFIKANQNVFEGDIATILNEGKEEISKTLKDDRGNPKKLFNFDVKLPNGEVKIANFNNASLRNFISKWGKDSKDWVGKTIIAKDIAKISAFGRLVDVIYWQPNE